VTPRQVLRALRDDFAMNERHFRKLHHARGSAVLEIYEAWLALVPANDFVPVDRVTARRLKTCLARLRAGAAWPEAIAAALASSPL
jgi:hypothetical protein